MSFPDSRSRSPRRAPSLSRGRQQVDGSPSTALPAWLVPLNVVLRALTPRARSSYVISLNASLRSLYACTSSLPSVQPRSKSSCAAFMRSLRYCTPYASPSLSVNAAALYSSVSGIAVADLVVAQPQIRAVVALFFRAHKHARSDRTACDRKQDQRHNERQPSDNIFYKYSIHTVIVPYPPRRNNCKTRCFDCKSARTANDEKIALFQKRKIIEKFSFERLTLKDKRGKLLFVNNG